MALLGLVSQGHYQHELSGHDHDHAHAHVVLVISQGVMEQLKLKHTALEVNEGTKGKKKSKSESLIKQPLQKGKPDSVHSGSVHGYSRYIIFIVIKRATGKKKYIYLL